MTIIEIEERKLDMLSENVEKGLRYMGKAMQIIDECMESGYGEREGSMGNRGGYGNRSGERESMGNRYGNRGYGERMGYRDDDEDWEGELMERRGVRGSGRGRR